MKVTLAVVPMGAPRMTQRDKWKKRPVIVRYHAYRDHIRLLTPQLPPDPHTVSWTAYFPFPKSYTIKKKNKLAGEQHREKPDRDNVDKAILDALFAEDKRVADGTLRKRWDDGQGARIELEIL